MERTQPIKCLDVPLGGQKVELRQVDFGTGGMSLLRIRIREGHRFTVFDIDAGTARAWAAAMQAWAEAQPADEPA